MKFVLVTGSNGGIGRGICKALAGLGYTVIGSDLEDDQFSLDYFIKCDLSAISNEQALRAFEEKLKAIVSTRGLYALINNAAVQILGGLQQASIEDYKKTLEVNLVAPFALVKVCYPFLKSVPVVLLI